MLKKIISASGLIVLVIGSLVWTGWKFLEQGPIKPVVGVFHQSKVDGSGHTRGVVQVDLMRQIMESKNRSSPLASRSGGKAERQLPTRDHPLLGHRAPALVLEDAFGKSWDLGEETAEGPVLVVFYLGFTCMACISHLVELDAANPRFLERGTRVFAVSGDAPGFSRERMRRFGGLQIPLLSDKAHAVSRDFGVWKTDPSGDGSDGEILHGTFIIDRGGLVRWAYLGNRPFTDVEALLAELDRWATASPITPARAEAVSH